MESSSLIFYRVHLAETDSTNRYMRDEAFNMWKSAGNADALLVTSDMQTAGRGQRGNIWHSAPGENLLATVLLNPSFLPVNEQFYLSQCIALALRDTLLCFGIESLIKWPNDVYVGSRKIAGVLVELDYSGKNIEQAIIGIGLNVNQAKFCVMERIPVSMKMLSGNTFQVEDILSVLLKNVSKWYLALSAKDFKAISAEYLGCLYGAGRLCRYSDGDGTFTAEIIDVAPDGHIILKDTCGRVRKYAFKEVEMLLY